MHYLHATILYTEQTAVLKSRVVPRPALAARWPSPSTVQLRRFYCRAAAAIGKSARVAGVGAVPCFTWVRCEGVGRPFHLCPVTWHRPHTAVTPCRGSRDRVQQSSQRRRRWNAARRGLTEVGRLQRYGLLCWRCIGCV